MRLFLVFVWLLSVGCNSDRIEKLEKQNRELAAKLDVLAKTPSLDLQAKCYQRSRDEFREYPYKGPNASFTSHYSGATNKCFVEIVDTDVKNGVSSSMQIIEDAFEAKILASYVWANPKQLFYTDVKPSVCDITLPNQPEKKCSSVEEFDMLAKTYMEN